MKIPDFSKSAGLIISITILCSYSLFGQINFEDLLKKSGYAQYLDIYNPENINTDEHEFSPYILDDRLIFVSSGPHDNKADRVFRDKFFDLRYAEINNVGEPLPSVNIELDTFSKVHEGPSCLSIDGQTLYFTRNNYIAGISRTDKEGEIRLQIYQAQKRENGWDKIKSLSFNDKDYTTCHPTISADGELMFFSADFPGGMGGMDLYVVKKYGDDWSDPVNLGPKINSEKK